MDYIEAEPSIARNKGTAKYFINPFGLEESVNVGVVDTQFGSEPGNSIQLHNSTMFGYDEWDQYGYKTYSKSSISGTVKSNVVGEEDKLMESITIFTISYKY